MKRVENRAILLNFLHFLALYASRPYLSLLIGDLGGGRMETGFILSLYSVVQIAAALPAGHWIARRGCRRPVRWGGAAFLTGTVLLTAARDLWMTGMASVLLGLGHSLILLSAQHIVTGVPEPDARARAVGWLSFFNSAGVFLGPLAGGYLQDVLGRNPGFLGAVVLSAAAMAAGAGLPGRSEERGDAQTSFKACFCLNKVVWSEVAMSGTVFFTTDILAAYLPLYGTELGWSSTLAGALLSANGLAQMAVRPFLGRLCARRPARQVLRCCLLAGGVFLACLGWSDPFWLLMAASAASGCAVGLANPLTLLTVSASAGEEERSQALALRVMANYAGQSLSPVLFGAVAAGLGLGAVFWCGGGVLLLCSWVVGRRSEL